MDATAISATAGATGAGLMAGIFFAFSVVVMQALDAVPSAPRITAMQQVNIEIINPLFMIVFAGTALLSVYLLIVGVDDSTGADRSARLGSVAYLLGVMVVTATRNVPLNNRLAGVDPSADDAEATWVWYRRRWMRWNHLRLVASVITSVCFCLAASL